MPRFPEHPGFSPKANLRVIWELVAKNLNGHLSFGDGNNLQADNIDGRWVRVTTPVAPNTDFVINHDLNRLPSGFHLLRKSASVDIYDGSVASTATQATLRATAGGVDIT